jgi:hypothetical protein
MSRLTVRDASPLDPVEVRRQRGVPSASGVRAEIEQVKLEVPTVITGIEIVEPL